MHIQLSLFFFLTFISFPFLHKVSFQHAATDSSHDKPRPCTTYFPAQPPLPPTINSIDADNPSPELFTSRSVSVHSNKAVRVSRCLCRGYAPNRDAPPRCILDRGYRVLWSRVLSRGFLAIYQSGLDCTSAWLESEDDRARYRALHAAYEG